MTARLDEKKMNDPAIGSRAPATQDLKQSGGATAGLPAFMGSQPDQADQTAGGVSYTCGVRTVAVPSPGRPDGGVLLKTGPSVSEGVIWLKNIGQCSIFIHSFGPDGTLLDSADPMQLMPGDAAARFLPPSGAASIMAYSDKDCSEPSALQYDPCAGTV